MSLMRYFIVAALVANLCGCLGSHNRPIQLIGGSGPVYPPQAKLAGTQGWVVVRYEITRDGRVMNARVDESEPTGIFDAAALKAVRSWRYNPQIREGEVQAVSNVLTTVRFVLGGSDAYDDY